MVEVSLAPLRERPRLLLERQTVEAVRLHREQPREILSSALQLLQRLAVVTAHGRWRGRACFK
jgi:hypothetical protein